MLGDFNAMMYDLRFQGRLPDIEVAIIFRSVFLIGICLMLVFMVLAILGEELL